MGWKKITGIYSVTNKINGKIYVGESKNILSRWSDHRTKSVRPRKKEHYTKELYKDIREYGIENFEFKILEECEEKDLKDKEIFWIKQLDTFNKGYNRTYGGDLPCETLEHHLTDHGMAALTIGEVKMCREAYKNGYSSHEIYDKYNFKEKITYGGFQSMWHGKTWKEIMPEVFLCNPRPKQKVNSELVEDIREKVKTKGETSLNKIYKDYYKDIIGWGTYYNIATYKSYI